MPALIDHMQTSLLCSALLVCGLHIHSCWILSPVEVVVDRLHGSQISMSHQHSEYVKCSRSVEKLYIILIASDFS